jgi:23S rRNA (cytidine1920-2'-O)/16S rRNA (cytidine1409-2'-O)-methyltransferase
VARDDSLAPAAPDWVGRGAIKLVGALDDFGLDVAGCVAVDLGASTGGFTEVLLRRGARRVYAVDVGAGLLHERIAADPRVVVRDRTNARFLESLGEPVDWVVGDLSFISWTSVLPAVARILGPGGRALLLVKPQFEVGRAAVGRGGRVRDAAARTEAIARVAQAATALGFAVAGGVDARIPGARAGNVEHFLHVRVG